jgi:hypothetical protein
LGRGKNTYRLKIILIFLFCGKKSQQKSKQKLTAKINRKELAKICAIRGKKHTQIRNHFNLWQKKQQRISKNLCNSWQTFF